MDILIRQMMIYFFFLAGGHPQSPQRLLNHCAEFGVGIHGVRMAFSVYLYIILSTTNCTKYYLFHWNKTSRLEL